MIEPCRFWIRSERVRKALAPISLHLEGYPTAHRARRNQRDLRPEHRGSANRRAHTPVSTQSQFCAIQAGGGRPLVCRRGRHPAAGFGREAPSSIESHSANPPSGTASAVPAPPAMLQALGVLPRGSDPQQVAAGEHCTYAHTLLDLLWHEMAKGSHSRLTPTCCWTRTCWRSRVEVFTWKFSTMPTRKGHLH